MERHVTQYTVPLKNEPGQLRRLTAALAREQVNVLGLCWQAQGEAGVLRFIADKDLPTQKALDDMGWRWISLPVLAIPLTNKPGELARLMRVLEDNGIAVQSVYGSAEAGAGCRLVLAVDKKDKAERLLASFGEALVVATH